MVWWALRSLEWIQSTTFQYPRPITQSTEVPTNEVESDDSYCVLAGAGGLSVLRRGESHAIENSAIPAGAIRAAIHLGGPSWLGAGVDGLVVVDVDQLCVSDRLEIPSVVSIAAATGARRIAAAGRQAQFMCATFQT